MLGVKGKKLLFLWFMLCCLLSLPLASAQPQLRVGMTYDKINVQDGRMVGNQAVDDYMRVLASYAGMEAVMMPGTYQENLARLGSGEIDVIADVSSTPERRQELAFSRFPVGFNFTALYLHGGTGAFAQSWERPLRLGHIGGNYTSGLSTQVLTNQGLRADWQSFPDRASMAKAYELGQIDGFDLSGSMFEDYEPAAYGDFRATFFVVRKDRQELLQELNRASEWLMLTRPTFLSDTYKMRQTELPLPPLVLNRAERCYLQEHPKLRLMVVANERPYAYIDENGELDGAMRVVADRLQEDLGVNIEVIPSTFYEQAYADMQAGKADILLNMFWNPRWGAERGLNQTAPFMTSYFTSVTRRTGVLDNAVIATLDNRLAQAMMARYFPGKSVRTYKTIEDCLEAVRTGQADVTYVRMETAQYQTLQGRFPDLAVSGRVAMQRGIVMGVPQDADPALLSLLDKEINHMGDQVTDDYYAAQTRKALRERSAGSFFYTYYHYFGWAVAIAALLALLAFWRYRRMRKANEAALQRTIDHDAVTGLYTSSWLERHGTILLARTGSAGRAVCVARIVRPEVLAGNYGREDVVELLQRMGRQLGELPVIELTGVRSSAADLVALTLPVGKEELRAQLQQLLRDNEFLTVGHMKVHVALEAGVCYLGSPAMDIRTAINNATLAAHGAQPVQFFNSTLQRETLLTSRMESLQQEALDRGEFQIWFQPKYDLRTCKCVGAEALVRWQNKELGFLMPGRFIPLFEQNGFISQLDFYNLAHVMQFQMQCRMRGLPVLPISVNQSRVHMREQGYLQQMEGMVAHFGTEGIELELTETAFAFTDDKMREHSLHIINKLHGMGFAIDMDDFGSGYSDLALLNQLPLDVMKIDRSLLVASEDSSRMQIVLRQMIDLGHALGMRVICEGIETEEQEQLLIACGCEYGQGFRYGRPMLPADYEDFLREHA